MNSTPSVKVTRQPLTLPTYLPTTPSPHPMFFERRVYQGSTGRVYPLPYYDRVAEQPVPFTWDAIELENEFLRVLILPQIGGRIHRVVDKTNNYDVVYHQPVIKPALVGLAGPWISGGIEFNWPQHHRPSTFMPTDVEIENAADGSTTVWMSEHDPLARMKGLHGVCLHPGRSLVELKVRAYNRTDDVQTFLWWANVATRVHEGYQSFFPPDTAYIADHAKRATSTFPLCSAHYYGVDYGRRARHGVSKNQIPRKYRPAHLRPDSPPPLAAEVPAYEPNDLGWYANIPVPTSYMAMGSREDFFGGYDFHARAGIVHVANHHISPGKKQWTWGNHEFGYAWDRNLTDADAHGEHAPYIELMAGVYTDNQPDFSYLQPGETKHWSQHWYPIRAIGPAQHANIDAAVSFRVQHHVARVGVAVTARHEQATIRIEAHGRTLARRTIDLAPDHPFVDEITLPRTKTSTTERTLVVRSREGRELIRYTPRASRTDPNPVPASEPPAPGEVASTDELYLVGLHLEQYRHATRCPTLYWREALRRDPGDSRCHLALGRWHLRRGEWSDAESHLRASLARLTSRNPNPADGEPLYQLGRCLRFQALAAAPRAAPDLLQAAYDAFYKATWNQAWAAAAFHALAEIDCSLGRWPAARDHLQRSLIFNTSNLRARDLEIMVLRRLGETVAADAALSATLALDPLDHWARNLRGDALICDTATRIDLALDHARAGFYQDALAILADAKPEPMSGTAPLLGYHRAWLHEKLGDKAAARRARTEASNAPGDHCFPARLEEALALGAAIAAHPRDAAAHTYLGHFLYDRRRHPEAIEHWAAAVRLDPTHAVAWRCLGLGAFNILRQPQKARRAYEQAFRTAPHDARLLYERDQLWKRLRVAPATRLRELEQHRALVATRDDLSLELCALYNQTRQPLRALAILTRRRFQPWEGGEGQALQQHVRTHLLLGRAALTRGNSAEARERFTAALAVPENLGEARHPLANPSDIHFWLGEAFAAANDQASAKRHWTLAATFAGDFQQMSVRAFSEMTYYSALARRRLGQAGRARKLLRELHAYALDLGKQTARIDYFATSLPTLLLFEDDRQATQLTTARFLAAQARLGLGQRHAARRLLAEVLQRDPNHALARDLAEA